MSITVRNGSWKAVWEGGRLADIFHGSSAQALDCVEVGEYDFALNRDALEESRADLGRDDVQAALDEWVSESGDDYAENMLPYLDR